MNTDELAAIQRRADAATPGPWKAAPMRELFPNDCDKWDESKWGCVFPGKEFKAGNEADAKFKAHARLDIPALLVEIERLRGLVEQPMGRKTPDFYDVTMIGATMADVENTGRQLQRRFPEVQFLVHDDKCVVRPGDLDTVEAERAACLEILEDRGCSYNGCSVEHGHDSLCPLAIARDIRARGGEA